MPLFLVKKYPQNLTVFVWEVKENTYFFEKHLLQEEKRQLSDLPLTNKQLEFAAVRHLAQFVCQDFLSSPYKGIEKDANGKPFFQDISYEISISHCLPYVAIALHESKSVGIDIEREQTKILKVAPRVFSEKEIAFCRESIRKACIIWACKEALYKIYAKKGLTFQTDLLVNDFEDDAETIQAEIRKNEHQQGCLLYHEELISGIHLCCGM